MKSYTLRPDTFTLNFNFTLSGTLEIQGFNDEKLVYSSVASEQAFLVIPTTSRAKAPALPSSPGSSPGSSSGSSSGSTKGSSGRRLQGGHGGHGGHAEPGPHSQPRGMAGDQQQQQQQRQGTNRRRLNIASSTCSGLVDSGCKMCVEEDDTWCAAHTWDDLCSNICGKACVEECKEPAIIDVQAHTEEAVEQKKPIDCTYGGWTVFDQVRQTY